MQKTGTRRLMDKNSASFQMFVILSSFIAVGSYSQISEINVTLYINHSESDICVRYFMWAPF